MEPFLGEIKLLPWNWAPKGWALCQGQLLPINQNTALFSLLGTQFGGNGVTNFALPDLRSRVPIHRSSAYTMGESGGTEAVTLLLSQLPGHSHALEATSNPGQLAAPFGNILAEAAPTSDPRYASDSSNLVTMNPASIQMTGGSQPHDNVQPYLVLSYCIATQGIFPSRN